MSEQWLPAVGFERWYEVSDMGRVRRSGAGPGARVGHILTPTVGEYGHLDVILHCDGDRIHRKVHALVLEAFIGPRPHGLEGCHNDGDASNNRASNLRWDTRSENALDSVRHGTDPQAARTHCPQHHPYNTENTYVIPSRPAARYCRACNIARARAWREARKAVSCT